MQITAEQVAELSGLPLDCLTKISPPLGDDHRFVERSGITYMVHRCRIAMGRWFTYEVYLPATAFFERNGVHYSHQYSPNSPIAYPPNGVEYKGWVKVTTQSIPSEVLGEQEGRSARILRFYANLNGLMESVIIEAYPEAKLGEASGGAVSLCWI